MKNITFALLLLLFVTHLSAQQQATTPIKVSLFAAEHADGHKKVMLDSEKGKLSEVALPTNFTSLPLPVLLTKNRELYIRSTKPVFNEELQKNFHPPISMVTIPEGIKDILVILVPTEGEMAYKAIVINKNKSNFPLGSYALINFSMSNIRGLVGTTKVLSKPGKIVYFKAKGGNEKGVDVEFRFQQEDSSWKPFAKTYWFKEKEKRHLLCTYLDTKTDRMKIKGIVVRDRYPKPDKTTE